MSLVKYRIFEDIYPERENTRFYPEYKLPLIPIWFRYTDRVQDGETYTWFTTLCEAKIFIHRKREHIITNHSELKKYIIHRVD